MGDNTPPLPPRANPLLRAFVRRLRTPQPPSTTERARIEQTLFSDAPGELTPYLSRVITLTALSALIATFGLLQNSSAVVIGAMLVSPLMQPIIGLAAAVAGHAWRRQLLATGLIIVAGVESVGVAALVAWITPTFRVVTITPEILARTSPGILDLGIACAAGAAGAYVTVRHKAAAALPGAAIAVALMPPLAALGILLERGNSHLAKGASLLFTTNLFGIVFTSVLVLLATRTTGQNSAAWYRPLSILVPLAIAAVIAYQLALHTTTAYRSAKDEQTVRSILLPQLRTQGLGIQDISLVETTGQIVVSVDVAGPQRVTHTPALSLALADGLHRPVSLIVRWTQRSEITALASPRKS